MNSKSTTESRSYSPLWQLILARLREFYREPEAVFWVYGFPILMVVSLGVAFRNKPVDRIPVDIQEGPSAAEVAQKLEKTERFTIRRLDADTARRRWQTGKTDVVVIARDNPAAGFQLLYDATRPESVLAKEAVDHALQQEIGGRKDPLTVEPVKLEESGSRYIDFLIPGLVGMSLMGGGLWGVGFVIVDMRIRKLLKRFLATPMKKSQFLAAIMLSRLTFMVPEVLVVLIFGWLFFGVVVHGSIAVVILLVFLGAFTFAGIGLLVASRAKTLETVSGLMNLVMLPMWVLSGIFFSSERFPDAAQPFIKILPLTPLIDALRAVMLEGESLGSQLPRIGILLGWAVTTFVLALRWFRWN